MASTAELRILADIQQSIKEFRRFQAQATKSLKSVEASSRRTSQGLGGVDVSMGSLIRKSASLIGVFGGLNILRTVASDAIEYQKALTEVATISEDVAARQDEFARSLLASAEQFGTLPADQAKILYQTISAGITDTVKANELLIASNKLAIGGLADTSASVDILTGVLNAYGQENISAAKAADILFGTVKLGKTTVPELASSLGDILPVANALGVKFEDVSGAVAQLTTKSVPTSQAVTQLNAVFTAVLKKQDEAKTLLGENADAFSLQALRAKGLTKFLQDLNVATGGSEQTLTKLFGRVEGSKAVIALASDGFQGLSDKIKTLGSKENIGAADAAFQQITNTADFQLKRLRSVLEGIVLSFTVENEDILVDALKLAVDGAQALKIGLIGVGDAIRFVKDLFNFDSAFDAVVAGMLRITSIRQIVVQVFLDIAQAASDLFSGLPGIGGAFEGLSNKIAQVSDSNLASIANNEQAIQQLRDKNLEQQIKVADASQKSAEIQVKAAQKVVAANKAIVLSLEDRIKANSAAAASPIGAFISQGGKPGVEATGETVAAAGLGTAALALQGAQGAVDLLAGGVGAITDTFLPGAGKFAAEIFKVLAKGPEEVRKLLQQFFAEIPKILRNVLDSIPVVFEEVAKNIGPLVVEILIIMQEKIPEVFDKILDTFPQALIDNFLPRLPEIISRLASLTPRVAVALARSLASNAVPISIAFSNALIAQAPRIADALISEIGGAATGGIVETPGGGFGGIFGFADGGEIPNATRFKNDGAIIKASAGENIVDPSTNDRLKALLTAFEKGALGGPQRAPVIQLDGRTYAAMNRDVKNRGFDVG